ncbi:MAG TPA: patatin-like phospholipase family protein [Marmoricola sp.]|nr:patatin-like phospholipase family protein [Marmoricola sp.]
MSPTTAFVLGGGGLLGAVEVGMLRALLEAGVKPDLVLGTSVGALNGALVAAHPGPEVIDRLEALWKSAAAGKDVYGDGVLRQASRAVRTKTHLHSSEPLRRRLHEELGDLTFEELSIPFQCCAASIERAAEHWFTTGRVVDAVMASAAVPGLLEPAVVGGEHYLDGGIVNSVPVGRAAECGAERVFVLQVGRVDRPLEPPRGPVGVARVSFEIARRHRFHREMAELPETVTAHVLPTGGAESAKDDRLLAYRDFAAVRRRIDTAYVASRAYLAEHL